MSHSPDPVIQIFNEALKLEVPERAAYLKRVCASEVELWQRVEGLLRAHESARGFLVEPVIFLHAGEAPKASAGEGPGDRVGNYKLIEQIGEGGCGVVFLAEQEEPVRRQVALKIVKPGMDTRSVIAQFESERQALALMEHPHIAQVLDAGATAAGRPYFVMELVRGTKITDYCDRHLLGTRARLELFVQVCHAVQHAHQKGIIHRDIKPSNILVGTGGEGRPLPKVIDFGIAKATTGQRLTDKTCFTAFEMLIGTPAYMSPEQAALKSADVDTRTDIYSLGVLLYELLTGETPFEVRDLFEAGLEEVRRDILSKEPIRPSSRLKSMQAAELAGAARGRQTEPPRLIRLIRGDLDWIVMKALEKDRARRYPTANALAADVQRHLDDEPVIARPPSAGYRLGKLISRNRLLMGSSAAIVVLLAGSLAVMSSLFAKEQAAHRQAEIEKRSAQVEAAKSTEVSSFLGEMLASVSPSVAMGRDTAILRELLARTDQDISVDLANQPEVESVLRLVLGNSYREIGDLQSAERMLRRALELRQAASPPDRRGLAIAANLLGYVLLRQGRHEEAERQLQLSLDLWRGLGTGEVRESVLALENFAMLRSRQDRPGEAEPLMRQVLRWRQQNMKPDHRDISSALNNLGTIIYASKKLSEAEQIFREVLEVKQRRDGDDHPGLVTALQNLATVTSDQGRRDEAKDLLSRAVALYRKRFHPGHPQRLAATLKLGNMHREAGELAAAEPMYREVMSNGRRKENDYNPTVATALQGLVATLGGQGKRMEAEALLDSILTPEFSKSPKCVPVLDVRVDFLARAGRWREAAMHAASLVELEPEKHEHYHTLAPLLVAEGRVGDYQKLCVEILRRFSGPNDIFIADRMAKDCLIRPSAVEDLTPVARMAETVLKEGEGYDALPLFRVCKALSDYRQGQFAAAISLTEKVGDSLPHAEVGALAVRAMALRRLNQPELARASLAQGSAVFGSKLPKLEGGDLGQDWRDWIIVRELLEEARALIDDGEGRSGDER
ncbi:tetratricopeptide repeat protein [Luteolibacter sp. Populi]|uniref:tetratricopeptide repeat protein n=1 Tax=Luteolibacter sp. Populi TaxID=3230487 RepID=UPI0034656FD8